MVPQGDSWASGDSRHSCKGTGCVCQNLNRYAPPSRPPSPPAPGPSPAFNLNSYATTPPRSIKPPLTSSSSSSACTVASTKPPAT